MLEDEPENVQLTRCIVPQLLVQANIAYYDDPSLDGYTTFVIGVSGLTVTIIRAMVSRDYIRSIHSGHPVLGDLPIYCSQPYDLTDVATRKEFLKVFLGIMRYFAHYHG